MGITISKRKQPKGLGGSVKGGTTFYRVKNPAGETIQDFKTKETAKLFVKKLKKGENVDKYLKQYSGKKKKYWK